MIINYLVLFVIFFYFIIASLEDIKKREVYDYLNYSLIFFILSVGIFDSILNYSFEPLKYVLFGLIVGFAIGSMLYYIGIWGGGDAKFLIGFSGAVFYLMEIVPSIKYSSQIYDFILFNVKYMFNFILQNLTNLVLFLNILFLIILLVLTILKIRKKTDLFNIIILFNMLLLLSLGLYFNCPDYILVFIAFVTFIFIFFSKEDVFNCAYFNVKKNKSRLVQGDIIDEDIVTPKKKLDKKKLQLGISKEDLDYIKRNLKNDRKVTVRKIIPFSLLIFINYFLYIINIIFYDRINLEILGFLFKFLFFSFMIGGAIAIFIILFNFFRYFKKLNFNLKMFEKMILGLLFFSSIIFYFVDIKPLSYLIILVPLYVFIKISKQLETLIFVKKKDLNKIVLGDWIVEDIYSKQNNLIYSVNDFKLGVDEKQLEKIKKIAKTNYDMKKLYVKDGLAFLPPLLIGFILMFFI
ncbi:MAG: prepilin peptidase [Nanoarchaeota archaeon]